jgi:hypothetical protein
MTKETGAIELREIYWGSGGNMARTWWCRGHVSDEAFAAALDMDPGDLTLERLWGRWVPDPTGEFTSRLHVVDGPDRGAFAFTVWAEPEGG